MKFVQIKKSDSIPIHVSISWKTKVTAFLLIIRYVFSFLKIIAIIVDGIIIYTTMHFLDITRNMVVRSWQARENARIFVKLP